MRLTKPFVCTVLAAALLLFSPFGFAQSDRGTITGTVMDPDGGVIPNAKVTAVNLQTGERIEASTTGEGRYTIPQVKAGPYNIEVTAEGFRATTTENVQVAVQVTRRVDVIMAVGGIEETVTVEASAPVIQAESAVLQTNVTERQVKELPLAVGAESAGRTPLSFIFLDSSVTPASGQQGTNASNFRVNGGQGLGTEILIDGAATRRAQNGTFFSEVTPGPNAYQEFTISTSNYSAEFGQSSGGVVNFTVKSGGNDFHGEIYDLMRHDKLNANTAFRNADPDPLISENPVRDHQHNFGFNVGGPIWIPGVWKGTNRAFFFVNYEGYRISASETVDVTVPTMLMRTGDFSELLSDSYILDFFGGPVQLFDNSQPVGARAAIPGNRIDLYNGGALIDPIGLAILQHFPEPTRDGVFRNFRANSVVPDHMDSWTNKVDFVISDKQRVSASYIWRKNDTFKGLDGTFPRFSVPLNGGGEVIAGGAWQQDFKSHIVRLQHDYVFSPFLLNHFNAGFTRYEVGNRNTTVGFDNTQLGFSPTATQNRAFPLIGFPGYGNPVTSADPRAYQGIGSTFFHDSLGDNAVHLSDFVSWTRGRHNMKFGGEVRIQQFNVTQLIHPGGEFNFRHPQTANGCCPDNEGWPIASLITGAHEFAFNSIQTIDPGWRQFSSALFFQDDIKLTPKLTLNVGVRYDLPGLRKETADRFRSFDPDVINPETGLPGALVGAAGQGGLQAEHRSIIPPDRSNVAPRIGFAYSLDNKTVIRAGYGIYYSPVLYGFGGNNTLTEGTRGYNTEGLVIQGGADVFTRLSTFPDRPPVNPDGQFLGGDVEFFDPSFRTGRTQSWSFDFQHELPWNLALMLGYVGSHGDRLRSDFGRLNALPLEALRLGAPLLTTPLAGVSPEQRAYAATLGFTLPTDPNAVFPGFTGTVAQALRPFPHYGNIRNFMESKGKSDYNAMQARLTRRFAQGTQFGLSYTWSKLITNAAEDLFGGTPLGGVLQNPHDLDSLRAVSPNNIPHALVLNYLIELPFGRNKRFLNNEGLVDKLVGGWQISGIHRYQSGLPLVIQDTSAHMRDLLTLFGVFGAGRPNLTGEPLFITTSGNGTSFQVLNPAAFASSANYFAAPTGDVTDPAYAAYYADPLRFFGTAPPVLPGTNTFSFFSENLSILKKTSLTERFTLELRAEVFNLLNRNRYNLPTCGGSESSACFEANSPDPLVNTNPNFGVTTLNTGIRRAGGYEPRVIQLGARFIF